MRPGRALRWAVLLCAGLLYAATMSGTIVSSDGHTMFQLTRSLVERGSFDVPSGNAFAGPDGRLYPKAGLGQALLGAPLYWAASRAAGLSPALAHRREAWQKFVLQLLGPLAGALLAWVFLGLLLDRGAAPRRALLGTALLSLATPAWPYAKTYLTEPFTAWLLLAAFAAAWRFRATGEARQALWAGLASGFAVLTKEALALPVLALAGYFLYCMARGPRPARALLAALAPLAACAALLLFYNHARFGSWLESGYGYEQTASAYSTPLHVGLFGLLLSPGKGLLWFAPPLLLLFTAWPAFHRAHRAEAWTALGIVVPSLLLNASFRAWGGDGSWGPRYLQPFVPLLALPVALWIAAPASRAARRVAMALLVAGALVQWGGVSVYYGSYLRETGAYPYTRAFEDPRFLEDVHWVPNYSPIVGHWAMFRRNLGEHLRGEWPRVTLAQGADEAATQRIPLSGGDQARLLHGLDFWFLYPLYVGAAGPQLALAALAMLLAALAAGVAAWRVAAGLERAAAGPGRAP
ncbi:MAG: hypothetical protein HZB25_09235 [Candidatus Eisenbacteria bacterium]|nr:hypothetical protein [Candidatus Eisenbacteria bacterium]